MQDLPLPWTSQIELGKPSRRSEALSPEPIWEGLESGGSPRRGYLGFPETSQLPAARQAFEHLLHARAGLPANGIQYKVTSQDISLRTLPEKLIAQPSKSLALCFVHAATAKSSKAWALLLTSVQSDNLFRWVSSIKHLSWKCAQARYMTQLQTLSMLLVIIKDYKILRSCKLNRNFSQ